MKFASMILAVCVLAVGSVGCGADQPFVEGEARLASEGATPDAPFLVLRAVPDHPDGFDPRRVYHGDEELTARFDADSVEFPFEFHLEGEETVSMDEPWLLLAWFSNDPHAHWIQPGQTFGAIQFEFTHHSHTPSFAEGLSVTIDQTAPPAR